MVVGDGEEVVEVEVEVEVAGEEIMVEEFAADVENAVVGLVDESVGDVDAAAVAVAAVAAAVVVVVAAVVDRHLYHDWKP